jgi:hypothetical protein
VARRGDWVDKIGVPEVMAVLAAPGPLRAT